MCCMVRVDVGVGMMGKVVQYTHISMHDCVSKWTVTCMLHRLFTKFGWQTKREEEELTEVRDGDG